MKLGWLRRGPSRPRAPVQGTSRRARASEPPYGPYDCKYSSPVVSRKIHGDMALSRPLLARAGVLSCEPPKSVGRLDCSTAWLKAGRNPSSPTNNHQSMHVHHPNIDHRLVRPARPCLLMHTAPSIGSTVGLLPRVFAAHTSFHASSFQRVTCDCATSQSSSDLAC